MGTWGWGGGEVAICLGFLKSEPTLRCRKTRHNMKIIKLPVLFVVLVFPLPPLGIMTSSQPWKCFIFTFFFFKCVSFSDFSDDKHLIQSVFWLCKNFLPLLIFLFLTNNSSSTASVPSLTLLPPACCPLPAAPAHCPLLGSLLCCPPPFTQCLTKKNKKKKHPLYLGKKKRNKSVFCC